MNQKLAIILILIAGGTFGGVAYSTSGFLQVGPTGCVGMACDAADYTSYSVVVNDTVFAGADSVIGALSVGDNGIVLMHGTTNDALIAANGNVINRAVSHDSPSNIFHITQSTTGKYQLLQVNYTGGNGVIKVYKNGALLQNLNVNFFDTFFDTPAQVSISPSGEYIVILGKDGGGAVDREVLFRGS